MSNTWFTTPTPLVPNTDANAEDVNEITQATETGFAMLPDASVDANKGFEDPCKVGTPTLDVHAATKLYVDEGMDSQVAQAAASAAAAFASETAADASETAAAASASNASTSATNASNSASSASTSASTATTQASNAAASASSASTSASTATTQASNASASAASAAAAMTNTLTPRVNLGNISGAVAIDLSLGGYFYGTITGNVTSITVSNWTGGAYAQGFILELAMGGTLRTISWTGSNWDFPGSQTPAAPSINETDIYVATSRDNGSTIRISLAQKDI